MQKKLPGLNGLRAIAASWILVGHTYQIAGLMQLSKSKKEYDYLFYNWFDPVNLFFVISGFIITFLLLKEKKATKTIHLKVFYLKRFLRIWPLYFLLLLMVFILSNTTGVYSQFGKLNLNSVWIIGFFLVTLNDFWHVALSVLPHYWSLSVEEQFYIFWPALVRKFSIIKVCVSVIIILFLLRNGAAYLSHHFPDSIFLSAINTYLTASKFSSMAIGGIGAIVVLTRHSIVQVLQNKFIKIVLWGIFILSFFVKFYIPYLNSEIQATLCVLLIIIVVQHPTRLLDNKLADLTGQISYGIYMYQWPLIPVVIFFLRKMNIIWCFSLGYGIPLVVFCYIVNFMIAYVSYFYFESFVLKLKNKS